MAVDAYEVCKRCQTPVLNDATNSQGICLPCCAAILDNLGKLAVDENFLGTSALSLWVTPARRPSYRDTFARLLQDFLRRGSTLT